MKKTITMMLLFLAIATAQSFAGDVIKICGLCAFHLAKKIANEIIHAIIRIHLHNVP